MTIPSQFKRLIGDMIEYRRFPAGEDEARAAAERCLDRFCLFKGARVGAHSLP